MKAELITPPQPATVIRIEMTSLEARAIYHGVKHSPNREVSALLNNLYRMLYGEDR